MIYNAGRGKQGKFKLKYVLGQEVIQFIYFLYCLCREILPMNRSLVHSEASQGTKCSQILHRALGAPTGDEQQGNGVCLCVTLPPSLESEPLIKPWAPPPRALTGFLSKQMCKEPTTFCSARIMNRRNSRQAWYEWEFQFLQKWPNLHFPKPGREWQHHQWQHLFSLSACDTLI